MKKKHIPYTMVLIVIWFCAGYSVGNFVNTIDDETTPKTCNEVFIIDNTSTLERGVNYNTPCFDKPTIYYHPSGENHTKTCKDDCCIYKLDTGENFTVEDYKECLETVRICNELENGANCFYYYDDDDGEDEPEIGFFDGGKLYDETDYKLVPDNELITTQRMVAGVFTDDVMVKKYLYDLTISSDLLNKQYAGDWKIIIRTIKEDITLSSDKLGNVKIKREKK